MKKFKKCFEVSLNFDTAWFCTQKETGYDIISFELVVGTIYKKNPVFYV